MANRKRKFTNRNLRKYGLQKSRAPGQSSQSGQRILAKSQHFANFIKKSKNYQKTLAFAGVFLYNHSCCDLDSVET